jgi:hypothetical protein
MQNILPIFQNNFLKSEGTVKFRFTGLIILDEFQMLEDPIKCLTVCCISASDSMNRSTHSCVQEAQMGITIGPKAMSSVSSFSSLIQLFMQLYLFQKVLSLNYNMLQRRIPQCCASILKEFIQHLQQATAIGFSQDGAVAAKSRLTYVVLYS